MRFHHIARGRELLKVEVLRYGGGQGGGGFGQKAGDGRKGAVGDDVVDCEGIFGCRADLAGLERRSFLDGSTNSN